MLLSYLAKKLAITFLILDAVDEAPYMLKIIPFVWKDVYDEMAPKVG